jgi:predicted PurR-regulated permease PerM
MLEMLEMPDMSSMFSIDKIMLLILFMCIIFVFYTLNSSIKLVQSNVDSIKGNEGSVSEFPSMIMKNEENINKVSNKLDVFIKYMLGQQVNAQAQNSQNKTQNQARSSAQVQDEDEDEDDIIVS